MTKQERFKNALEKFVEAGHKLSENWDEDSVKSYPEYLPDFEEFLSQFACIDEVSEKSRPQASCL